MVVQCTHCNSRFRVADERVPEKGVKVRCTKCTTVFRVTRADAVDAKPGASERASSEASPVPLPGVAPTAPSQQGSRQAPVPGPVSYTYGAASPNLSLDFDLNLGAPPPPPAPPPRAATPAPPPPPARVAAPAPPPQRTPSPAQSQQIMNDIDAALDAAVSSPNLFGTDVLGGDGLPGLPSLGGLPQQPTEDPVPQGPSSIDLFGDRGAADRLALAVASLELDVPPPAPPPPPAARMQAAPALDDLGFLNVPPPAPAPQAPPPAPPAPAPKFEETDPFAGLDSSPGSHLDPPGEPLQPPAREPARASVREPTQTPAPAPAAEPGMVPSSAREIDLPEGTSRGSIDLAPTPDDEDRMRVARIAPIKGLSQPDISRAPKLDPKTATKQRLRKEFASAILNVVSAALVCYAGIVAIAVIRTPRPIGWQDLGFTMVWLAFGAESAGHTDAVRTAGVHSGVYQTNTGDELFYVQGQVQNDTSRRHEAMYVTLELHQGSKVLDRAYAVVGLRANPEDLYNLTSRNNEDLQALLAPRAATRVLEPHRAASFVGVFDLSARALAGTEIALTVNDGVPPKAPPQKPKPAAVSPQEKAAPAAEAPPLEAEKK